jgi:hypothetical protein
MVFRKLPDLCIEFERISAVPAPAVAPPSIERDRNDKGSRTRMVADLALSAPLVAALLQF